MERTPTEVIQDHLTKRLQGNTKADIADNYHPDVILLSSFGVFRGHDGIVRSSDLLARELGDAKFAYNHVQIEGDYGFLEWSATQGNKDVCDGADAFVVRRGKIVMQTVHYTPHSKTVEKSGRS